MKKYIANIITGSRVTFSLLLLFISISSVWFYILYLFCGLSDMIDGAIARKTGTVRKFGAKLDSIADIIFISSVTIVLIPIIKIPFFILLWISIIFILRIISLILGFIKFKSFSSLHTYLNKFTGIILFFFPFLYTTIGLLTSSFIICAIATISSLEELIINIYSKNLNRDIKSLFELR